MGAHEMTAERRRYNVGAVKLPYARRDVAHRVLTADDPRDYLDIRGSDTPDNDPKWGVGEKVAYSVMLTDAEAAEFRAASNCRYVELDETLTADASVLIPRNASRQYMGMQFPGTDAWHGRDVTVAILDGGTTTAVRQYMGWTLAGRSEFGGFVAGSDEITTNHGCLVAPCGVPAGGRILDAIIADNAGSSSAAAFAAAVTWAVDNGAQVINYSYSGTTGSTTQEDAIEYAAAAGVPIVASAGNDGLNLIRYPAAYCTTHDNMFSSGNFNEATNTRWPTSNYHVDLSGVTPGGQVLGLSPAAVPVLWNGTSASAPHKAGLIARICTGGRRVPMEAAEALKTSARDTGQAAAQQGAGAWDLRAALLELGDLGVRLRPGWAPLAGDLNVVVTGGGFLAGQKLRPSDLAAVGTFTVGDKIRMSDWPDVES